MNQKAAIEDVLKTVQRCAILGFLRHMASQGGEYAKDAMDNTTASEFVRICVEALEKKGETPQNEIQWFDYGMRLLKKHGYPQGSMDEMMALITGLRGGV